MKIFYEPETGKVLSFLADDVDFDGPTIAVDDDIAHQMTQLPKGYLEIKDGKPVIKPAIIEHWRANAMERAALAHAEHLRALTGNASQEERDTWPVKAAAARAVIAGEARADQIDMIKSEADLVGEDIADLATVIVIRADQYSHIVGIAAGQLRKVKHALSAADDKAEIEQILVAAQGAIAAIIVEIQNNKGNQNG